MGARRRVPCPPRARRLVGRYTALVSFPNQRPRPHPTRPPRALCAAPSGEQPAAATYRAHPGRPAAPREKPPPVRVLARRYGHPLLSYRLKAPLSGEFHSPPALPWCHKIRYLGASCIHRDTPLILCFRDSELPPLFTAPSSSVNPTTDAKSTAYSSKA
ncbi:hypothetical protein PVAP13_7KG179655 [Panicum virgatum]|uniref:Uncharacterized protein n=1 Tax=Panicum virgatum TaxID=38727 RepID=A0A8T0QIM3_PANVG|nr:hypothetical protein PVAP13_7KG179655 [Panicum virgatum]